MGIHGFMGSWHIMNFHQDGFRFVMGVPPVMNSKDGIVHETNQLLDTPIFRAGNPHIGWVKSIGITGAGH